MKANCFFRHNEKSEVKSIRMYLNDVFKVFWIKMSMNWVITSVRNNLEPNLKQMRCSIDGH